MNLMDVFSMVVGSMGTFQPATVAPQWNQLLASSYVQDTLAPLLSQNTITVNTQTYPPIGRPDLTGLTSARGDTISMFGRPNDGFFTHEVGHVLDTKNIAPEVSGQVAALYNPRNKQAGYGAKNDYEYVAEAFRQAMDLVRQRTDAKGVQAADKKYPGVALWHSWISKRLEAPQVVTR